MQYLRLLSRKRSNLNSFTTRLRNHAKLILIALSICVFEYVQDPNFLHFIAFGNRAFEEGDLVTGLLALSCGSSGILCLTLLLASGRIWLIAPVCLGLFGSATFAHCHSLMTKQLITDFEFEVIVRESRFATYAIKTFWSLFRESIQQGAFFVLVPLIASLLLRGSVRAVSLWIAFIPVIVVGAFFGPHLHLCLPSIFTLPRNAIVNSFTGRDRIQPRMPLAVSPVSAPAAPIFIYLVDESVRGDALTVNNPSVPTTPALLQENFINYGIASAGANCSAPSNLILRNGLVQSDLPDTTYKSFTKPSIFQFAKNAGFSTYFIDGQNAFFEDYFTDYDLPYTEARLTDSRRCATHGDCFVLDTIAGLLVKEEPIFIYAVKQGCHWNYDDFYPFDRTPFLPIGNSTFSDKANIGSIINSYLNAVSWNVGTFFDALIPMLNGREFFLVYTSDHGQSYFEGNSILTHCTNAGSPSSQANVPLLVLTTNEEMMKSLQNAHSAKFNASTHYDIFPTFLRALGYDSTWVAEHYGASLFDRATHPRKFWYFVPFSPEGGWIDFVPGPMIETSAYPPVLLRDNA